MHFVQPTPNILGLAHRRKIVLLVALMHKHAQNLMKTGWGSTSFNFKISKQGGALDPMSILHGTVLKLSKTTACNELWMFFLLNCSTHHISPHG